VCTVIQAVAAFNLHFGALTADGRREEDDYHRIQPGDAADFDVWRAKPQFRTIGQSNTEKDMSLAASSALTNRTLFVTSSGHIGLAHESIDIGNMMAVLYGGDVPYVVRPINPESKKDENRSATQHKLIAEAYVHGIMYGEFIDRAQKTNR